jgi:hypothetical protein
MTRTRTKENAPPVENRLHKSMRAKAILMAVAGAMAVSCPKLYAQHIVGNELGR